MEPPSAVLGAAGEENDENQPITAAVYGQWVEKIGGWFRNINAIHSLYMERNWKYRLFDPPLYFPLFYLLN